MKRINSICLKGIVLAAALYSIPTAHAQENGVKPFMGDQAVTEKLFNLEELNINYHFTAELGGGNLAIIEYSHLTDWNNKGELAYIIATAQKYYAKVQDSFKGATSSKRLDLHIPLEGEPVTARIFEYTPNNNIVLLKGDMQSPLKLTMDTIRVLKTVGEITKHKQKQLVQMQYTFLLKDIDQINTLNKDAALIADVENRFDSVVTKYINKWSNPNKWTHNLNVTYYPLSTQPNKHMTVNKVNTDNEKGKFYQAFVFDGNFGLTFFRNTPCPMVDLGISYKWPTRNGDYVFVRLSNNTFSDFVWLGSNYTAYGVSFDNLELGWLKSKKNSNIPIYRTSVGMGYSNNTFDSPFFDPTLDEHMWKFFASFSLSKLFTLTFDQYFAGEDNHSFTGLSLTTRLW